MKAFYAETVRWAFVAVLSVAVVGCGSSNLLREYEFKDRTAAAVMATPPMPEVFTDSFFMLDQNNPIRSIIRIGTTIVKGVEAQRTEARLDSAMKLVDVPEQIRVGTLENCSNYLHYRSMEDVKAADFILDMNIQRYGIDATSWTASVHFKMDVEVQLLDNARSVRVWKARVKGKQPITREIFGFGGATGDVITAVALSKLSVEELARGFEHLADYTADRIARKLRHDLVEARSSR